MTKSARELVVLGRISGVHGVRGWVKVFSGTEPRENILNYEQWLIADATGGWQSVKLLNGRRQGQGVHAQLEGVTDRDQALALMDREIAIARDDLPPPRPGEYYWCDLVGLKVVNTEGVEFGEVTSLFETGSNDVLVVKGDQAGQQERLLPFIQGDVIQRVDMRQSVITVDWDADF